EWISNFLVIVFEMIPNSARVVLFLLKVTPSENMSFSEICSVKPSKPNRCKRATTIPFPKKKLLFVSGLVQFPLVFKPVMNSVKCLISEFLQGHLWYVFPNSISFISAFFRLLLYSIASKPKNNMDCRNTERSWLNGLSMETLWAEFKVSVQSLYSGMVRELFNISLNPSPVN